MNREQKIEALADSVYPKMHPAWDGEQRIAYVDGILAGIALRDAELLAMEVDDVDAFNSFESPSEPTGKADYQDCWFRGARWQFEQFIKAIKGSSCDQGRLESDNVATGTKGDGDA